MRKRKQNKLDLTASSSLNGEMTWTAPIDFTAASEDGKTLPSFKINAYNGGAMNVAWGYPVVVELSGLKAAAKSIPILLNHDTDKIVGHTSDVQITPQGVSLGGVVSGTGAAASEVVNTSKNGFPWQASIGASVTRRELVEAGKSVTVNGKSFTGPIVIARESVLRETSFVPLGADSTTSASIAAQNTKGIDMEFAKWLEANGFDPVTLTDKARAKLQAQYDAEMKAAGEPAKPKTKAESNLDAIIAAETAKQERYQEIVKITAEAIKANPASIDLIKAMSDKAIEADQTPQAYELDLLRAMRPQATQARIPNSSKDEQITAEVLTAGLCISAGMENPDKQFSPKAVEIAAKTWKHGVGLIQALEIAAARNTGERIDRHDLSSLLRAAFAAPTNHYLAASGASTISLPGILSNVANKFLRAGFESVENSWRAVAAIRNVRDFKAITSYTMTGDFEFKQVSPGGELQHAEPGEKSYSNQADTRGIMCAIDRRDLINDDLGALTQLPRRIGRGGALSFNKVFWTAFMANTSFFPTDGSNGNYFAGVTPGTNDTRLNIEGLTRAETAFFDQTDPNDQPLGAMPRILLVPNALNAAAAALMNSTEIRDTTSSTKYPVSNPHAGKFSVVRSSYLSNASITGYSTAAWYLLADPNDIPVIEVALLNGVDSPTVETASADFNTLGIQMRGFFDFGAALQEFRGGVKMKGEAA